MLSKQRATAKLAFRFVLIIGIVNLFADLTYEGARSITGPFMGFLYDKSIVTLFCSIATAGDAIVYPGKGRVAGSLTGMRQYRCVILSSPV